MKLSIERAALLRSLTHVQNVVERRTTIPILSNVKLDGADGSLSLQATDLELEVHERCPAEVEQAGATTVSAHMLYDIVRKLPEGSNVRLESSDDGGRLTISTARMTFTLPCLPAEDFPTKDGEPLAHRFRMAAADLERLIDKSRFAISTEETRYYLNGIHLHATEEGAASCIRAVATDGHRLARVEAPLPEGAEGIPPVIVPRKTVGEVRKLVDETDEEIEISLSERRIRFVAGPVILASQLIDGVFPDYQRVIPAGNDKIMTANVKALTEAVDRVSTLSTDKTRAIKLKVEPDRLTVTAESPDAGRAVEEIDVGYAGETLEIGFNARYILDMTAQITGEELSMEMASAGAPSLVRDSGDDAVLFVLMPMRV